MQIFVPNAGKLLSKTHQIQTQAQTQAQIQSLPNLSQLRRRFNYGKPLLGRVNRFSSHGKQGGHGVRPFCITRKNFPNLKLRRVHALP